MSISRIKQSGIKLDTSSTKTKSLAQNSGLCGPVLNISASIVSSEEVSLSWSAPTIGSPTSYTVSVFPSGGSVSYSGTTANVTGLIASTSYIFTVTANNSLGSGVGKNSSSTTTSSWNVATGGTESTISDYNGTGQTWKVHNFSSSGTLNVTQNSNPFDYLIVGGGAGGSGGILYQFFGAGGGSGVKRTGSQLFPAGNSTVTIGGAGGGGPTDSGSAGNGGTSSLALFGSTTITATGGSGVAYNSRTGGSNADFSGATNTANIYSGGGAGAAGNASGTTGGAGFVSTITGSSVTYGQGGGTGDFNPPPNIGRGGNARSSAHGTGFPGSSGVAIVSYRVG